MGTPPPAERPSAKTPKALIGYPPPNFGVLFSFFNTFTHLSQFFFGQSVLVSMNKKCIQPILLRVYHIFPKKSTTKNVSEAICLRPNGSFRRRGPRVARKRKNGFVSKAKPFFMMRCTDRFFIAQSPDLSLREFRNGQAGRAACRIRTRAIKANAPHPDKGLSLTRRFTGTADQ